MIKAVLLLFLLPAAALAAWEWRDLTAREAAHSAPEFLLHSDSTLLWRIDATIGQPYELPDVRYGLIGLDLARSRGFLRTRLHQTGTDGYRETSLLMMGGIDWNNYSIGGGMRLGLIDVQPLPVRSVQAVSVVSEARFPLANFHFNYEQPVQSESHPAQFPERGDLYFSLPFPHAVTVTGGYRFFNKSGEVTSGIEWTPVREVTLNAATSARTGWSAGVTLRVGRPLFTGSSFLREPLGWSSLWSVSADNLPNSKPLPGWRYPVNLP